MTMVAAIQGRTVEAKAWPAASRVATVEVCTDLSQAEAIWRELENQYSTPYQRFDFLAPWQRQIGTSDNASPLIIIACDSERKPLLLLPLVLGQRNGIRIARFMGGKHTTFNMGLWRRDFADDARPSDIKTLTSGIREHSGADVLALVRQPLRWRELPNPMAQLQHQPSPNDCPVLTIEPGAAREALISNSFRQRLKGKERKLQKLTGYRYYVASSSADIARLLDWFFTIKPLRMALQKLPNVFAESGVEDFIRSACHAELASGAHAIDLHALECDDEVIAISGGVADQQRFSMMFNTYTTSNNSHHSPGLILMRNIVDFYAERGCRELDLGIGSDSYKKLFCKGTEPIFDSFIPLSLRGKAAAAALSGITRGKHLVKHNQTLFSLAQMLRGVLHR